MKHVIKHFLLINILYAMPNALAQSGHNHIAHTHGVANMTVLFEAGQLLLEIETPAANILGYEHAPHDAETWRELNQIKMQLQIPQNSVILNPDCTLLSASADLPFTQNKSAEKNHEIEQYQDSADHQHKSQHSDIFIKYEWQCDFNEPPRITLRLFEHYNQLEKIHAHWVTSGKQGANQLTKARATLEMVE